MDRNASSLAVKERNKFLIRSFFLVIDQQMAKRKLQFNEERYERKKLTAQIPSFSTPFYFYPQTYINNFQPIVPPGWAVTPGNPNLPTPMLAPYTESINFIQPPVAATCARRVSTDTAIISPGEEEQKPSISVSSCTSSMSTNSSQEEAKVNKLSPLDAFCASLFRPSESCSLDTKSCSPDEDCVNVVDDEE